MRLRNVKNKDEILNNCNLVIKDPVLYKSKWKDLFKNDNPIYIEIGTGKCKFIKENAIRYPNINFIGIEKAASILSLGVKNIEYYPNLLFINYDAAKINDVFSKEIDKIYLNFSDPWPKARHEKRRLTSPEFLDRYESLFKDKKIIEIKTDNRNLFEYSIVALNSRNYKISFVSLDLHKSEINDNINTEYEDKFSKEGFPIYKLKCYKK